MTKQTEALKLALRSIRELVLDESDDAPALQGARMRKQIAEKAIREALAEQPKESPKFDPNESFAREEAAQARVREFMRNH